MTTKVYVTDFVNDELEPEREIFGDIANVIAVNAQSQEDLFGVIEDADALMVYHMIHVDQKLINQLNQCKIIVRCGVGFDNVDYKFAAEQGIPVSNVPDYGTEDVADSALGMALTLTRGIHFLNSRLRASIGQWHYTQASFVRRLRGKVFGIVGLGRIGTAAALRAKAFGMDVVFYDPYRSSGTERSLGIRRSESLQELLSQSKVLSLHCPLTDETHHLINRDSLSWMPQGSYLVNTARGAVVNTNDLPDAIATGQLAGAGIDVLDVEPPPEDDPLLVAWRDPSHPCHDRVIVNPHSAFYTVEGLTDMRIKGSNACKRAILGEPIPNVVNGL